MTGDYRKARKLGLKHVEQAQAHGRDPYPPALDELLANHATAGEVPVGIREIPLALVVGTKTRGRQNVLSCGFMPLADEGTEFATKWGALYESHINEGIREPIKAYEYLQRFYVQEGNKRVSVMRYLDAPDILADVTRVTPSPTDTTEYRLYREFLEFYAAVPLYGLTFTKEGSYRRLARLLGGDLTHPWPEEDVRALSAAFWRFTHVYEARGGSSLALGSADAFLIYLTLYATANPLDAPRDVMGQRIYRMWDELVAASQGDAITFVEEPPRQGGVTGPLKAAIGHRRRGRVFRAAFIYDRSPQVSGWVAAHEQGRQALQERMADSVETTAFSDCTDDAAFDRAIEAAVADESDLIVTVSPRQIEQAARAAVAHPDRTVVNCSINLSHRSVRTFHARMYEVKFVMGALAASLAGNHQLGYLAVSPIYGSVAEVNAFALGAALVDPYATIHLKWLGAEGYDWRRELREANARVIAGLDYRNPAHPDEPCGLYRLDGAGRRTQIALAAWDWGRCYELIVRSVRDNTWNADIAGQPGHAVNHWWGMGAGVVHLSLEEGLPLGQRKLVALLTDALTAGMAHPFDGVLATQRGIVQDDGSGCLSPEQVASMRWLSTNISGRLPKSWELSRDALDAVRISGVISPETDAEP
ncbi:MAG: BMP family ABC transporter substrate-binding protein [Acidobacteriota bacterium]|nr:BMP family ABC transporter substrate-binding protein [Acidobacteriota bacterium]